MAKTGRPTKLTPELQEKLCNLISRGFQLERAAELAGIGKSTFFRWKDKAKTAKSGIYRDFREAVKEADAKAEIILLESVRKTALGGLDQEETVTETEDGEKGSGDYTKKRVTKKKSFPVWQASAWILERRFPERWARDKALQNSEENEPLPWSDDEPDPLGGK
jgi:hypothetical protein